MDSKKEKLTLTIEQESAINHDKKNAIVTASAGSGKTHVMIERAINLIEKNKATVREIMAVTYTESAANEMKVRLKKALDKKVLSGREDLAEQINDIALADISTIHSFCARLIREYSFVAEKSPDFTILPPEEAEIYRDECLNDVFDSLYEEKEDWFLLLTDRYKASRKDDGLKKHLLKIYKFIDSEANRQELLDKYKDLYTEDSFDKLVKDFKNQFDIGLERLASQGKELKDLATSLSFKRALEVISETFNRLNDALYSNLDTLFSSSFEEISYNYSKAGKLTDEQKSAKEIVNKWSRKVVKYINDFINDNKFDLKKEKEKIPALIDNSLSIAKLIRLFIDAYEKKKDEENALDFSDLEHIALKVLENSEVENAVKNKYKYIFVDEYQDVSGVQKAILTHVSKDNLFMVGDPKQSIYAFRGCESDAFNKMVEEMEKTNGEVISLNANFRSSKNVVDFVNKVFDYSMTKEYSGIDYKNGSELEYYAKYVGDDGKAQLHFIEKPSNKKDDKDIEDAEISENNEKNSSIYDIVNELGKNIHEGDVYSALVAKIIREELGNPYYHLKDEKTKNITFGDIVILSRAIDNQPMRRLIAELDRFGIPVSSVVSINVLDFAEVQTLVNVLKLIDCFNDDIPLFVVLKSVFGNFTNEELLTIAKCYDEYLSKTKNSNEDCRFFYKAFLYAKDNIESPLKEKINSFYNYFNKLRFVSDFLGAKRTLEKAIADSDFMAFLLAGELGRRKQKRVNYFVDLAEANGKSKSIREYLKFIEKNKSAFLISEQAEDGSVRVMTIHKSKGLEFPVVLLVNANKTRNSKDESDTFILSRNDGFACYYYDDSKKVIEETFFRTYIKNKLKRASQLEEQRNLYVALTRAQNVLHVIASRDDRVEEFVEADKFIQNFPKSMESIAHPLAELISSKNKKETKEVLVADGDVQNIDRIKADISFAYPYKKETTLPLKTSVTASLKNNAKDDSQEYKINNIDFEKDEKLDSTSVEKGIIAHKILENYDFNNSDFDAQIKKMVECQILTEEQVKMVKLESLKCAIKCPELTNLNGRKLYREQGFIVSIPSKMVINNGCEKDMLLQGIIDLMAIDENTAKIIDYKYSTKSKEQMKEHYQKQLELYAYAIENVLNKKVVSKTLVNILTGEYITF